MSNEVEGSDDPVSRGEWPARPLGLSGDAARTLNRPAPPAGRNGERYLTGVEANMLGGEWIDPERGKTTLRDWAPRRLATKRSLKPKTRAGYESLLRSRVLPALGEFPLAGIERVHVEAWVSRMEDEGLSASRIRQAFNVLAAMLDAAIANDMIGRNVARGVDLPRLSPAKRRFLTQEQVWNLADAIDPRCRVLILVLAYSGMRWGEAIALRRRDCELLRRRLHVTAAVSEIGSDLIWGTPKTHRVRTVSLPAFVCDELAAHLAGVVDDDPEAIVFATPTGLVRRKSDFRRRIWKPAVDRAGEVPSDLTPHELRHTAASLLIASGAGPKSVQAQLGQSSITVTFDAYGHLFEGHLDEVMDRLDEAWRRGHETDPRPKPGGVVPLRGNA